MATPKQEKLAKKLIDLRYQDKPQNTLKDILLQVGYSYTTAKDMARDIITSKGVQESLEKYGFSEGAAKAVAVKILAEGKEENQVKIIQEIFKVKGTYAPEKRVNLNVFVEVLEDIDNNDESIVRKQSDDGGRSETRTSEEVKKSLLET